MLAACTQNREPGPDVGECADVPDGIYSFGQIGIGVCLAGPADIEFIQAQDGSDWLVVSNVNHTADFSTASIVSVDWSKVDLSKKYNFMHEVAGSAVPIDDFLGEVTIDPNRNLLLSPGRLTEVDLSVTTPDRVWVVDASDPADLELWSGGSLLEAGRDPSAITWFEDFAFVANVLDHTISVFDTTTNPILPVDVDPISRFDIFPYNDADGSGSTGEVIPSTINEEIEVDATDAWTLEYIAGTWRIWTPVDGGFRRISTGGGSFSAPGPAWDLRPEDLGSQVSEIVDPYFLTLDDRQRMVFADDGVIRTVATEGPASDWDPATLDVVLRGQEGTWWERPGSVGVAFQDEALILAVEASQDGGLPSVGIARGSSIIGVEPEDEPTFLAGDGFDAYAQPFIGSDTTAGRYRMWLAALDGDEWVIASSQASDFNGLNWGPAEEVLRLPGESIGAPVVFAGNGRYEMLAVAGTEDNWRLVQAASFDGINWDTPTDFVELEFATGARPSRVAIQTEQRSQWSMVGSNFGPEDFPVQPGIPVALEDNAFELRVSHGFELGLQALGDGSANSIEPASAVDMNDGTFRVYMESVNTDNRIVISAWDFDGTTWTTLAENILPADPFGELAKSPVVTFDGSSWDMYYEVELEARGEIRHATSSDGLSWSRGETLTVPELASWEQAGRSPAFVTQTTDGMELWYDALRGEDFSVIAKLTSTDGVTFTSTGDFELNTSSPGNFDDSAVSRPAIIEFDGERHMLYTAYNGSANSIGRAVETNAGWERVIQPIYQTPQTQLGPRPATYFAGGVGRTVPIGDEILVSGDDSEFENNGIHRVGRALVDSQAIYPMTRVPTPGDTMSFISWRGTQGIGTIDLGQTISGFTTQGPPIIEDPRKEQDNIPDGPNALILDEARGFLYVTNALADYIIAVDIRDDSTSGYVDANYLDIEALILARAQADSGEFRGGTVDGDVLYLATSRPEAITLIDLTLIEDNAVKEMVNGAGIGVLPIQAAADYRNRNTLTNVDPLAVDDAGVASLGAVGPSALAISDDYLIVPHLNANSITVYDKTLGAFGERVAHITDVGEGPTDITISPDGKYAVIANYNGTVVGNRVGSSLVVLDIDPDSPTYLEIATWIVNR